MAARFLLTLAVTVLLAACGGRPPEQQIETTSGDRLVGTFTAPISVSTQEFGPARIEPARVEKMKVLAIKDKTVLEFRLKDGSRFRGTTTEATVDFRLRSTGEPVTLNWQDVKAVEFD